MTSRSGTTVATSGACVAPHAALTAEAFMMERLVRATVGDWRPWAIGAAVSIGWALLAWRRQRAEARAYEEWWQRRDHARGNGRAPHPELFV
jgi:hypothetical protein